MTSWLLNIIHKFGLAANFASWSANQSK